MAVDFGVATVMTVTFTILSAYFLRNIIGQHKPGRNRLLLYLPIVILNFCVPLLFTLEGLLVFGRLTWTYLVAWLATNKGVGFCFNRGILASKPQADSNWSNAQFVALYMLPILPSKEQVKGFEKLKELGRLLLHSGIKFGMLLFCYAMMRPDTTDILRNTFANGFGLYFFLAHLFDTTSFVALLFFDITTIDNFNYPFFATSLTDFWGKRWNTMTAKILRTLSYDMIIDGALVKTEQDQSATRKCVSELRRVFGILGVFALSGVIHEAYLWSIGSKIECQWLVYFIIQAPLLILEKQMKLFLESKGIKSMPKPLSMALFFAFNVTLGALLFVPQARRSGGDQIAHLVQSAMFGHPLDSEQ